MTKVKDPMLIKQVFSKEEYDVLHDHLFNLEKRKEWYDEGFGRYHYSSQLISDYSEKLIPLARELFESSSIVPSYSLFSHYQGENANLFKHKDDNACTYTIDMCIYQNEPWDLWVNDKPYTLEPNQALAYYGNEQEHWREKFPNPSSQYVAMVFFHFVEPDHWWITKGPRYIDVVRKTITEEEFLNEQSNNK
jgi:hypothetical protein